MAVGREDAGGVKGKGNAWWTRTGREGEGSNSQLVNVLATCYLLQIEKHFITGQFEFWGVNLANLVHTVKMGQLIMGAHDPMVLYISKGITQVIAYYQRKHSSSLRPHTAFITCCTKCAAWGLCMRLRSIAKMVQTFLIFRQTAYLNPYTCCQLIYIQWSLTAIECYQ